MYLSPNTAPVKVRIVLITHKFHCVLLSTFMTHHRPQLLFLGLEIHLRIVKLHKMPSSRKDSWCLCIVEDSIVWGYHNWRHLLYGHFTVPRSHYTYTP